MTLRNCLAALARHRPLHLVTNRLWPRACILAYHRISAPAHDPFGQCVSPTHFAEHLHCLRRNYTIMALDELVARLPRGNYADRTVAVTFDDGYVDNLTTAYPLLAAVEMPLTIFVTVQPVLEGIPFWWDRLSACLYRQPNAMSSDERSATVRARQMELRMLDIAAREAILAQMGAGVNDVAELLAADTRPLTVDELQHLAKLPGVTIGAHTMHHPVLSTLTPEEQRQELQQSRAYLERWIDTPVAFISYPFGKAADIAPVTPGIAAQAQYRAAFTTMPRPVLPRMPLYTLPRLTVHDWTGLELQQRLETFWR